MASLFDPRLIFRSCWEICVAYDENGVKIYALTRLADRNEASAGAVAVAGVGRKGNV